MKRLGKFLICLLFVPFVSVSCLKHSEGGYGEENGSDYKAENPLNVAAPGSFTWATMNSVGITVAVDDQFNGQYDYLVEVFDRNPVISSDATLVTRGFAKKNKPFSASFSVPNLVKNVFVRQSAPNGLASVRMLTVTGENLVCDFSDNSPVVAAAGISKSVTARAGELGSVDFTAPDDSDTSIFPTSAPAGATVITASGWKAGGTASEYAKFILNSQTPVYSLDMGQYAEIYVTEDVTLSGMNSNGNRRIFILPGKKLTVTADVQVTTANWIISVGQNASLEITGLFKLEQSNKIYNLGTVSARSYMSIATAQFYNKGTFNVLGTGENDMQLDVNSLFYNTGVLNAEGGLKTTGKATVYNGPAGVISVQKTINQNTAGNRFINDNKATCGAYISTGSASTENNGEMIVYGKTETKGANAWINNGSWITETMETVSYSATYINRCKLIVNDYLDLKQARFVNADGAYIFAQGYNMVNTRMEVGSKALFIVEGTASFSENRPNSAEREGFYGVGTDRALLKFGKVIAGNTAPNIVYYSGNLQIACDDHPEAAMPSGPEPRWSMDSNVEWAGTSNPAITIPETDCNPGFSGNTTPPVNPGLEDVVDPYTYTYMFEDEWPLYNDYDMNDIVIRVSDITKTTNAENKVTKIKFTYSLEAVGASRAAAAAVMLDKILSSDVQSVTYSSKQPTEFVTESSGVESGQVYAVIPLFSDAHGFLGKSVGTIINTVKGGGNVVTDIPSITIEVVFANPMYMFDVSLFNMFIITNSGNGNFNKNSRLEIHMRDYSPTSKANTSLFGTHNDNSTLGASYSSIDNLVWGIVVPSEFRWPTESRNIKVAYSSFIDWVQSGGEEHKDWWETPANINYVF